MDQKIVLIIAAAAVIAIGAYFVFGEVGEVASPPASTDAPQTESK